MQNFFCVCVVFALFRGIDSAARININSTSNDLHVELNLVDVVAPIIDKDNKLLELDVASKGLELWEAPRYIQKNYPYYLSGHDEEEGRPIWVMEFGRMNLRPLVEEGGEMLKAFEKYTEQIAYRIVKSIKAAATPERPVTEAIFILDFDGLNLQQVSSFPVMTFGLNLVMKNRELIMDYLGPTIFINANFLAENTIRLVRPALGPAFQKVEIYGTNKQTWIPKLRRLLGSSSIPPWYGGSSKNFKPVAVYGR